MSAEPLLRRPIARYRGGGRVAACPFTKDVVADTLGTHPVPRRRIAGKHIRAVRHSTVPVRGYRSGPYVLAIAPEHAEVSTYDWSNHDRGDDIDAPWVPVAAHFEEGREAAVIVPTKEVDL
ncbi:hypothetical protein [Halorubrum tebenquichense]|uniref:Uncharacterized protein n=1 Tax=Halorubrum tebenquichense DSM 14210 TaxID=1227485 RepID=M0DXS4_9EURY|nr:hypothetical protein [Halorubrum tebenquichense]ELZ38894.1 hypothetical protein C472_05758 [Halorubrum tebenquichense DSM 14210]